MNWIDRDLAGMVLPAWNDFWSSLACPRAPPSTPNNRFRRASASKFTFPPIFCHQRGYNPTCVPLRELNGQLTKIVALHSHGGGSNIKIVPTPPCPAGDVSHVRIMNVDATKIWQMDKTFLTFFTFSKYFASFLPLITIPSQNYLSFVPQAVCQQ